MVQLPSSIDITRQRVAMTPLPGAVGGATEAWAQDVLARVFSALGIYDISFEPNAPSNTKMLWFSFGNPPTGQPGSLLYFDIGSQSWIPMTPAAYRSQLSVSGRPTCWRQEDVPADALPMDWWSVPSLEKLFFLMPVTDASGVSTLTWVDIAAAQIDPATVFDIVGPSTDAGNSLQLGGDGRLYVPQPVLDVHVSSGSFDPATRRLVLSQTGTGNTVTIDLSAFLEVADLQSKVVVQASIADGAVGAAQISLGLGSPLNTAPVGPPAKSYYIVGPTPTPSTDVFFGQANKIAFWSGTAWSFLAPWDGFTFFNVATRTMMSWSATLSSYQQSVPAAAAFNGGTITQSLTINGGASGAAATVSGSAGTNRSLIGATGALTRWLINLGSGAAETGGNAGSDFQLWRANDAGTLVSACLSFLRSTGAIQLEAAAVEALASQLVSDPTALATLVGGIVPVPWNGSGQIPQGSYVSFVASDFYSVPPNINLAIGQSINAAATNIRVFPSPNGTGAITINYGTWRYLGLTGYDATGPSRHGLVERVS